MVSVERENGYLLFFRDGVEFYDHAIPSQADSAKFFRHLMDKNWMAPELKAETVRLVQEWWDE